MASGVFTDFVLGEPSFEIIRFCACIYPVVPIDYTWGSGEARFAEFVITSVITWDIFQLIKFVKRERLEGRVH